MRVSLAATHLRTLPATAPHDVSASALLAEGGPRVILGGGSVSGALVAPIQPRADTLFGPRGACLAARSGPLFVCDTGHHRLLIWKEAPGADHAPADFVIGHPDFNREGRNAKGEIGAATLNV